MQEPESDDEDSDDDDAVENLIDKVERLDVKEKGGAIKKKKTGEKLKVITVEEDTE